MDAQGAVGNGFDSVTAYLGWEHGRLNEALRSVSSAVERGRFADAAAYGEGLRFFDSVLPDHNAKEEHILYPTLDRLLRPAERAALVARLQREAVR